ncbi:MAG: hypothetical protein HZA79_05470 [Sphingobacteriales bacterium]|nr:hypothetical protein [Sphingobacteriales bacterium]
METIGVTRIEPWFVFDDDTLVKDLFYFDKLMYSLGDKASLENLCNSFPYGADKFKEKMEEIEKLEKAGLISEIPKDEKYEHVPSIKEALKHKVEALDMVRKFTTKEKSIEEVFLDFLERFRIIGQLDARSESILLNSVSQNSYTPIIRGNYRNFSEKAIYPHSPVLSVLIKKFPLVSNKIELEDLIAFKNDPDSQLKLFRLKEWVLEISKKDYTEKEIEQKIDYLLQEYTKQLELHKLKYSVGAVESIVTVSLEVLENIVKLNFSKAAKVLFDLKKQELTLMEAEQKMTGRELAYLYKLKNRSSS